MKELRTSVGCELPVELAPNHLIISPDGARVAVGGIGGLHILEAGTLHSLHSWSNGDSLCELVFDRTGRILIACTSETMFAIDVETGREIGSVDFGDWEDARICVTADAALSKAAVSVSEEPEFDALLLLKLSPQEFSIEGRVSVPNFPGKPIISIDGRDVYVIAQDTGVMSRVDIREQVVEAQCELPAYPSEKGVLLSDSGLNLFVADMFDGELCSIEVPDLKRVWTTTIPDEILGDSWDGATVDSQLQFGPDQSLIYFGYIGKTEDGKEEYDDEHARWGLAQIDSVTGDIRRIEQLEDVEPTSVEMLTSPGLKEIYFHVAGAVRAYDASTLEATAETPGFDRISNKKKWFGKFSGRAVLDDARSRMLVLEGNTIRVIDLQESNFGTAAAVQGERRILLELPE